MDNNVEKLRAAVLSEHAGLVDAVAVSPDGQYLASAGNDNLIIVRNWETHETVARIESLARGYRWSKLSLAWSPDSKMVAGLSWNRVRVFSADTGGQVACLGNFGIGVFSVCWAPDDSFIAVGGPNPITLYDVQSQFQVVGQFPGLGAVHAMAVSPSSRMLVAGTSRGEVMLLDVGWWGERGMQPITKIFEFPQHAEGVKGICFDSSGDRFASAGDDKVVRMCSVSSRQVIWEYTLQHHMWAVAISPCGKFVAAGAGEKGVSLDSRTIGDIYLLEAEAGQELARLRGHSKSIGDLCFHPDGAILVSAGNDGTVMLWDLNEHLPH